MSRYPVRVHGKLAIAFGLLLLLACSACVLWSGLNLPPPLWMVKYGLSPGCEPTGDMIPAEGVEFVIIGPGIARIGSVHSTDNPAAKGFLREGWTRGNIGGRLCVAVGIAWGKAPKLSPEMPVHWCEFPEGFGIAKTEVTNAQYERFDPEHGRSPLSQGDTDPVVNVSWMDARKYCEWLSEKAGLEVRLPSESEWEAACRGGRSSEYVCEKVGKGMVEYAWYEENSGGRAHAVATKAPNAWGLHDLSGNVWEWCEDTWHASYARVGVATGPGGGMLEGSSLAAPTDGTAWAGWCSPSPHFSAVSRTRPRPLL